MKKRFNAGGYLVGLIAMSWALSYGPREWQKIAIKSWVDNKHRGIAKVVTGGGKTFFALMCIKKLADEKPGLRFFIVVPTLALRDQWALDIIDDLGVPREHIYSHGMDKSIRPEHRIVLMVINSARTHGANITEEGEWMLIVDECHRAASEENRKAMEGDWVSTLGLSATPERQYDEWYEEHLLPKLGGVIANYDYVQAKKDGVIVDFELRNYMVPLTEGEQEAMKKLTTAIRIEKLRLEGSGLDSSDFLLNLFMKRSRISQRAENRIPLAIAICKEHVGKRILVFHEYIEAADQLTRLLDNLGFRVAAYHSKIGDAIRISNLKMYRDGMIDVLVTCRALDEGLNVPDTEVGVIVSSTKSTRQRIQRMGRILRIAEGKDIGLIVSFFSSHERDILEKESESLEEVSTIKWYGI